MCVDYGNGPTRNSSMTQMSCSLWRQTRIYTHRHGRYILKKQTCLVSIKMHMVFSLCYINKLIERYGFREGDQIIVIRVKQQKKIDD